jgi:hypothetical protein
MKKNLRFFNPSILPESRNGDMPTLILVVGIFLVCGLTVFSLIISLGSFEKSFGVLENMVAVNSMADQIRFYENVGLDPTSFLDITKENNAYNITSKKTEKEKIVFYIEYIIPANTPAPK